MWLRRSCAKVTEILLEQCQAPVIGTGAQDRRDGVVEMPLHAQEAQVALGGREDGLSQQMLVELVMHLAGVILQCEAEGHLRDAKGCCVDEHDRAPYQNGRCRWAFQAIGRAAHRLDIGSPTLHRHPLPDTPVNLQNQPSTPHRMLPDSCTFELLDADVLHDPANGRLVHLYSLVARCLSCETVFKAEEGQGLISQAAARVVRCPTGCGQQAFKPAVLRAWHSQVATPA